MSTLSSLIDPASVLFGATFIFYGSALTLSFLLSAKPEVVRILTGVLMVILFLLFGTLAIEFSSAASPSYVLERSADISALLSTHRWLLFQLPIMLTLIALVILSVYQEKIVDRHAVVYRASVIVCVCVSFASLIIIGLEGYV